MTTLPKAVHSIDTGGEFSRLLAEIASESIESSWSSDVGNILAGSRLELARLGHTETIDPTEGWEDSNGLVRDQLVALLQSQHNPIGAMH